MMSATDRRVSISAMTRRSFDRVRGKGACPSGYFRAGEMIAVDAINDAKAYVTGKKLLDLGRSPDRAALA